MIIGQPTSKPVSPAPASTSGLPALLPERGARAADAPGLARIPKPKEPAIALPQGTDDEMLKPWQKRLLSDLAEAAYKRAQQHHAHDDLSMTDWRHRESIEAAGVRISEAQQKHYNLIKAHFELLAGESGKAFNTHMREHTSPLRIARHKLDEELKKHQLQESYATHIAGCKFKQVVLDKLTAKQVWALVYDIRRNFTKGKKAARAAKGKRGAE